MGAGGGVLHSTHTHIPLCTCKRINLLGEPGSGLLLCWGKFLQVLNSFHKLISGCKKVFVEGWSY